MDKASPSFSPFASLFPTLVSPTDVSHQGELVQGNHTFGEFFQTIIIILPKEMARIISCMCYKQQTFHSMCVEMLYMYFWALRIQQSYVHKILIESKYSAEMKYHIVGISILQISTINFIPSHKICTDTSYKLIVPSL